MGKGNCETFDNLFYVVALLLSLVFVFIAMKRTTRPVVTKPKEQVMEHTSAHENEDSVLKQLIDSGSTFYGVNWCGYTKKQLSVLGINEHQTNGLDYVDCDVDQEVCSSKGIDAFPTWQINGKMFPGFYDVHQLRELLKRPKL